MHELLQAGKFDDASIDFQRANKLLSEMKVLPRQPGFAVMGMIRRMPPCPPPVPGASRLRVSSQCGMPLAHCRRWRVVEAGGAVPVRGRFSYVDCGNRTTCWGRSGTVASNRENFADHRVFLRRVGAHANDSGLWRGLYEHHSGSFQVQLRCPEL